MFILGLRHQEASSHSRITVQEIAGSPNEDFRCLSAILCTMCQAKWIQKATGMQLFILHSMLIDSVD